MIVPPFVEKPQRDRHGRDFAGSPVGRLLTLHPRTWPRSPPKGPAETRRSTWRRTRGEVGVQGNIVSGHPHESALAATDRVTAPSNPRCLERPKMNSSMAAIPPGTRRQFANPVTGLFKRGVPKAAPLQPSMKALIGTASFVDGLSKFASPREDGQGHSARRLLSSLDRST